jgi:tetrahydromethanopterin S-methyltransferase subunit G
MNIAIDADELVSLKNRLEATEQKLALSQQENDRLSNLLDESWQNNRTNDIATRIVERMLHDVMVELGFDANPEGYLSGTKVTFDNYRDTFENGKVYTEVGKSIQVQYGAVITNTMREAFMRIGITNKKEL